MTYKDPAVNREWHRRRKAEIRAELRAVPLHRRMGIATHVHRQAILSDPRIKQWDATARVFSFSHLYRESITLPGAANSSPTSEGIQS